MIKIIKSEQTNIEDYLNKEGNITQSKIHSEDVCSLNATDSLLHLSCSKIKLNLDDCSKKIRAPKVTNKALAREIN